MLAEAHAFTQADIARIMEQLLSAMEYCHARGVFHEDLRPENILFEKSTITSRLKIIDFGRPRLLRPNQLLVELAGSVYRLWLPFGLDLLYGAGGGRGEEVPAGKRRVELRGTHVHNVGRTAALHRKVAGGD